MITRQSKEAHEKDIEVKEIHRKLKASTKKHGETLGKLDAAMELSEKHHKESKPGSKRHHLESHKLHLAIAKIANELEREIEEHKRQIAELRKFSNDCAEKHKKAHASVE